MRERLTHPDTCNRYSEQFKELGDENGQGIVKKGLITREAAGKHKVIFKFI